MRRLFIASFALLALLVPLLVAASGPADEKAIRDRLDEFQSAWNKDDVPAMVAMCADDATLINPVGTFAQGRDAITKVITQEHTNQFKNSKYEYSDVKFQWVTPDIAI